MAKLENYKGGIQLIAGITQKGGDFALVEAGAIQVDEDGKRLDAELTSIHDTINNLNITTKLFETSSYEELESKNSEANSGDIGVVTSAYGIKTAYYWNKEANNWAALDGNYDASNVYFKEDLTVTSPIGTITQSMINQGSGNYTLESAGKSLSQVFSGLLAQEKNPSTPVTSASITSNNIGEYEVGTTISINYSFNVSAGAYAYGPSNNGVTWSGYSVTFNGETKNSNNGTFSEVTVEDTTNLTITGQVDQSEGVIPKTNLGNDYPASQIKAKEWRNLSVSTALTGYRAWFCGYLNGENALSEISVDTVTSDVIRGFTSSKGNWPSTMNTTKVKQMFFAAPKGKGYKPTVKNSSTTAPKGVKDTPLTIMVEGKNNYTAIEYEVWYVNDADAEAGSNSFNITKE